MLIIFSHLLDWYADMCFHVYFQNCEIFTPNTVLLHMHNAHRWVERSGNEASDMHSSYYSYLIYDSYQCNT